MQLKNYFLRDVTSCMLVKVTVFSEDRSAFIFVVCQSNVSVVYVTLKIKTLQFFETSVTAYESAPCEIPQDLILQHHRYEKLKSLHITASPCLLTSVLVTTAATMS